MSTGVVYEGAQAPEAYIINLTPGDTAIDLSTVTAATLNVLQPDGTSTTWSATRSNQTSTTLTVTHLFALADLPIRGRYVISVSLTVPGGVVRTAPRTLTVKGKFEV